jgi:L-threonylcarbamoyladenylate synthase
MKTQVVSTEEPNALAYALDVLNHHGSVVFPTDTVYGLGGLAFDPEAIERLFVIKGRQQSQAIAVLLGRADDLSKIADHPNPAAQKLARAFWPGPLTLVVPQHPDVPEALSPLHTIGVRIPDHPFALKLLQTAGPMAVTSANLSGEANTMTAGEALDQLDGRVHLILDGGKTPGGVPSTVVNTLTDPIEILRKGPIKKSALLKAIQ